MHETVLVNVSASKGKNWLRELQKEKNTIAAAAVGCVKCVKSLKFHDCC